MNPKQTATSSTYRFANGGFVHIDRQIMPILSPGRLGAVPPPKPKGQRKVTNLKDEKMPTAEAGRQI